MPALQVICYLLMLTVSYPLIIATSVLGEGGFRSLSVTRCTLGGLLWLYVLNKIVRPYVSGPLKSLPIPPGARFLSGHGRQLFSPPVAPFLLKCAREVPNKGLIFMRSFLHIDRVLVATTPDVAMEVLNNNPYDYEKPKEARKFLSRVLGNGLIVVEGAEHKAQRKAVSAAFQGKHVKELVPIFWTKAIHMVNTASSMLSDAARSGDLDSKEANTLEIGALASRCTLDIIGQAGFNRDFNTLDNSEDELAQQYETITNPDKGILVLYFAINMLLPPWLVELIPWNMNQRILAATSTVRRISRQMVAERKIQLAKEEKNESIDILSVLMRSTDIPEDILVDECLTFLAAGHETTSSAISWASYFLGMYQYVQNELRRELETRIPADAMSKDSSFAMTASLVDSLPLLHGVCCETLRLYPTVPITSRVAIRKTEIHDQVIPKGTEVLICPWIINRLETVWGSDSEDFKPSRWIGSEDAAMFGGAQSRAGFLTFIYGPRSCIGQGFAKLEMKCILAALLLRFRFELAHPDEVPIPAGSITIKPKYGMKLVMTEITRDK